MRNLILIRIY